MWGGIAGSHRHVEDHHYMNSKTKEREDTSYMKAFFLWKKVKGQSRQPASTQVHTVHERTHVGYSIGLGIFYIVYSVQNSAFEKRSHESWNTEIWDFCPTVTTETFYLFFIF